MRRWIDGDRIWRGSTSWQVHALPEVGEGEGDVDLEELLDRIAPVLHEHRDVLVPVEPQWLHLTV
ncbi:hypothetical protein, partial [Saccharopolyspora cebuensis]|uniref:hypothetical protein n=1 Tax=Saccharopolyspora cebuensis TaxID=418759 RepID=UPI0031EDDCF0